MGADNRPCDLRHRPHRGHGAVILTHADPKRELVAFVDICKGTAAVQ